MKKEIGKEEKINKETYHRFGIDDETREKISPYLTGQREQHGKIAKDKKTNRKFINTVICILKIGYPERDSSQIMENKMQYIKNFLGSVHIKKQVENKSEKDSRNKNRIKFVITSKNFSKMF